MRLGEALPGRSAARGGRLPGAGAHRGPLRVQAGDGGQGASCHGVT